VKRCQRLGNSDAAEKSVRKSGHHDSKCSIAESSLTIDEGVTGGQSKATTKRNVHDAMEISGLSRKELHHAYDKHLVAA
jgi:hypothetical protein